MHCHICGVEIPWSDLGTIARQVFDRILAKRGKTSLSPREVELCSGCRGKRQLSLSGLNLNHKSTPLTEHELMHSHQLEYYLWLRSRIRS